MEPLLVSPGLCMILAEVANGRADGTVMRIGKVSSGTHRRVYLP